MTIVTADSTEAHDMSVAKEIAETLNEAYPGWMWAVNVTGGVAIVKNMNLSSLWGFVLKYKDIMGDFACRKKQVIQAGGELLERCHLPRGARQEFAEPLVFEGAKNWKR